MMSRMDRRNFLQTAGGGLALALSQAKGLRANPYGMPIGLQLYTVRDHLEKDLTGTLKKVAEIGYRDIEVGGLEYYGKTPTELRRILSGFGMTATSRHCSEEQLKSDPEGNIAKAKECGITYIVLASLEDKDRKSLDAVKRDAEWFNQVGAIVARAGCTFAYHGHNFDYAPLEGSTIYDELIKRTDPKVVNFQIDCFWCVRAGKDPVDYFHRYPGRFPLLHIKDLKPGFPPTTGEGPAAFTEVGKGVIDWKRIFRGAKGGGLKHFYVEQDECDGDSLEAARISYNYLHALTV